MDYDNLNKFIEDMADAIKRLVNTLGEIIGELVEKLGKILGKEPVKSLIKAYKQPYIKVKYRARSNL